MADFKGTPAPWHVFGETTVYGPGMGDHGILEQYVAEACYEPEPNVEHPLLGTVQIYVTEEEAKANANLIAAAPEMLIEAERIMPLLGGWREVVAELDDFGPNEALGKAMWACLDQIDETKTRLRVAIAKALGQS